MIRRELGVGEKEEGRQVLISFQKIKICLDRYLQPNSSPTPDTLAEVTLYGLCSPNPSLPLLMTFSSSPSSQACCWCNSARARMAGSGRRHILREIISGRSWTCQGPWNREHVHQLGHPSPGERGQEDQGGGGGAG